MRCHEQDRARGRAGPQALGHTAALDALPSASFYEKGESELSFKFFLSSVDGTPFPIPTEVAHPGNNIIRTNPDGTLEACQAQSLPSVLRFWTLPASLGLGSLVCGLARYGVTTENNQLPVAGMRGPCWETARPHWEQQSK